MRVTYTTADPGPVGQYRVSGPAEALAAQGKIELVQVPELRVNGSGGNVTGVKDPPDTDVLILQRPTNKFMVQAIPFYQERGIAVVVELDDDLERIPAGHAQHRFYSPKRSPVENWDHLKRACRIADFVTVSSEALQRYAPHGRVVVLRNCVPAVNFEIQAEHERGMIGWGGFVRNHPTDLQVTRGAVAAVVNATHAKFRVVGDGFLVREHLCLRKRPNATGKLSLDEYLREVAKFDIGIAPLEDNQFSRAKTWLKGLEYASLGVFPVASDLYEYRQLQKVLGEDLLPLCRPITREWVHGIVGHMQRSDEERAELRARASELTIESNCGAWLEAWQQALEHRQAL